MLEFMEKLVRKAGEIQMRYFENLTSVDYKGKRNLLTNADIESEEYIKQAVLADYPDHEIFAEESGFRPTGSRYRWFIDPIDGTTNFAHGYPFFACAVALAKDGVITHAITYAPYLDECFTAARGQGVYLNGRQVEVSNRSELIESVIATGFAYNRNEVKHHNGDNFLNLFLKVRGIRRSGCASIDLAYVAAGRLDGFWEPYLCPWDLAGGSLMVLEAGGKITDFFGGEQWFYEETMVATNGHIHEKLRENLSGMDEDYPYRFKHFVPHQD